MGPDLAVFLHIAEKGSRSVEQRDFLHRPSFKTCTKAVCLRDPALCESVACQGLPTRPRPEIGRILVTGASGYVGGRLVVELLSRGYQVRAMVRRKLTIYAHRWPGAEIVEADALRPDSLLEALQGVRVAYYLIHSMMLGPQSFSKSDLQAAHNFAEAAQAAGVERIVYLGGWANGSPTCPNTCETGSKWRRCFAAEPPP